VNSKLILFEEKIHLTHLHGLILKGGQPFWVPQPNLCPCEVFHIRFIHRRIAKDYWDGGRVNKTTSFKGQ
jgi:hypothetical protein